MQYHYNLATFFEDISTTHASQIALRLKESSLSYKELYQQAKYCATLLKQYNICTGQIIALISSKEPQDYAMMLACLMLGITYTNVDPENPIQRTQDIFETCSPSLIFSHNEHAISKKLAQDLNIIYTTSKDIPQIALGDIFKNIDKLDGDTIAYIMFTSGSTGKPKGAAISHQNLIHFINWTTTRYSITPQDNFANISPMYFDNSVFDFYTALFSGASLTPISKMLLQKPLDLVTYITEKKCTIWFSVPSMLIFLMTMRVLSPKVLTNIRTFTFGGEGFPKTELQKLFNMYKEQANFINVYGPTETTCICSSYTISKEDFTDLTTLPSLGTINPNFSYVILDNNKPATEGELCLLGPNVSKGYYKDPERTAPVFSLYTDNTHYKKPMYKTGDIVKEENGLLYFLGRADNQIKHMGYRIELEEIEMAINSLPAVLQSAVLYDRKEGSSHGHIVSFFVPEEKEPDLALIKSALHMKLPPYMQPNKFIQLATFPKNANGKIDKKQLKQLL